MQLIGSSLLFTAGKQNVPRVTLPEKSEMKTGSPHLTVIWCSLCSHAKQDWRSGVAAEAVCVQNPEKCVSAVDIYSL